MNSEQNKEKENPGDASPVISNKKNKIKFSHFYKKFGHIKFGDMVKLVKVSGPFKLSEIDETFIYRDTVYSDYKKNELCFYKLTPGKYLILYFCDKEESHYFTTIRSAKPGKEDYYRGKIGELFKMTYTIGKTK